MQAVGDASLLPRKIPFHHAQENAKSLWCDKNPAEKG